MNVRFLLLLLWMPFCAMAQGFSGLGASSDGFAMPQPQAGFAFPNDHGPHPDFSIEWWYLTANLESQDGTEYGIQWTLFRTALSPENAPGWASPQVWFAHAAVTTPNQHFTAERFARGGIGQAGVQADPFHAWIDEWSLSGPSFRALDLHAQGADFGYAMTLNAQGPLVFHGAQGFSVKSPNGQASHYYSQPFFDIKGTLNLPEGPKKVTGTAWLDREWSSQPLDDTQLGWDWFSLSFESGSKLMGFQVRDSDGGTFTSGTWIEKTGQSVTLPHGSLTLTPKAWHSVAGRDVPVTWNLQLPEYGMDVIVDAVNPNAWMGVSIPYWEGPVSVRGSHPGKGYLEMTGYE